MARTAPNNEPAFLQASLRPPLTREHGSWAMLLVPLVVGAAAGGAFSLPVLLFALASLSLFLARHPLGLLLRPGSGPALPHILWGGIFLALGALFGLPLLLLYRLWGLAPLGVALGAAWLLHSYLQRRGLERRAPAQLLGIAALAVAAPGAYLCAGGAWGAAAVSLWGLSFLYFSGSVTFVPMMVRLRSVKPPVGAWDQRWSLGRAAVLTQALALLLAAALSAAGLAPGPAALALLPQTGKVFLSVFLLPSVATIKRLGWQEVLHALLFGLLLILAYRLGPL